MACGDIFQAIADPTRRNLLDLLREGEQAVTQLAAPFDMSMPAISQHLQILCEAGLVKQRRAGRMRLYRLNVEPLRAASSWLAQYEQIEQEKQAWGAEEFTLRKVKKVVFYPYSVEQVWQVLTDRRSLSTWLMDNNYEPRLGCKFWFLKHSVPGLEEFIYCEVLELNAPERLTYTWQDGSMQPPTTVTWLLTSQTEGTQLCLEHSLTKPASSYTMLNSLFNGGWDYKLRHKLPQVLYDTFDRIK